MIEKEVKKIDGQTTQKTSKHMEAEEKLLKKAKYVLENSGYHWNSALLSVLGRQSISKILYYNELYEKILDVPGVICEFGVFWGGATALLSNLRGIYEPYNYTRKIVGFDTFSGFYEVDTKDGSISSEGDFSAGEKSYSEVNELLSIHESFSPISHIKKHELIKGDASKTFNKWLDENPASIISMAILDFDIYKPTKSVLSRITERFTKGSLLLFDELSCPYYPGETLALMETIGIGNLKLRRNPHMPWCSYAVWE